MRLLCGADQDFTLSRECLRTLDGDPRFRGRIRRVFIIENEINFLSFMDVRASLVLFGQGCGFESLAEIPWLADLPLYYWVDIDTHGFADLDQLRARLPHVRSLLMEESTLLAHREFWACEPAPQKRDLHRLTIPEAHLYDDLRENRFGERVRLEQERVDFGRLRDAVAAIAGGC
jgi:hypothetical protein